MYSKYKSPSGYFIGCNNIDTYGVDHSTFSTRDELAYQMERQERENKIIPNYNKLDITDNYPPSGTGFLDKSDDDNYGFGSLNIRENTLKEYPWIESKMRGTTAKRKQTYDFVDKMRPALKKVWKTGESLGELAADTQIAYDYWQQMNQTGNNLVATYGSNQGADIDDYYHPLLQCQLAKISPTSRDWGLRLGYAKEILDYHKKKGTMPMSEISADSRKDLHNNLYGSNLGYYNPDKNCWEMLDDRRTPNMRKANIR